MLWHYAHASFQQEVNPGVHQYACTCLQNHCIWDKLEFWRDALYTAIQAELVRVYAEVENEEKRRMSDSGAVAGEGEEGG